MNLTAEITRNDLNKDSSRKNPSTLGRWLKQQGLFFYFLQVPFKWVRWLLGIALCLLLIGALKHFADKILHWPIPDLINVIINILSGLSGAILMISLMLVLFLLPAQVVHLVTSKQTLLLKSFRSAILSHIIFVPLLHSLIIAWVLSTIGSNPNGPHFVNLFCLIFLLLSSFLHISIYGSQKSVTWPFLVGFLVPVYQFLAYKLNSVDWRLLLTLAVASWAIFTVWWLKWKPLEHRAALFIDTFTDPTKMQRLQGGFGQGIFAFLQFGLNKNIENLFDGLLLGRAKSPLRIMLVALSGPIIMTASFAVSISVLPAVTTGDLLKSAEKFSFMFATFFVVMPSMQIAAIQFNIKKSWLFFRGKRTDFFNTFEKLIVTQSFYQVVAIVAMIYLVAYFCQVSELQIKLISLGIAFGVTECLLTTYLQLFLYHATKARRSFSINLATIFNVIMMVPIGMFGAFLGEKLITEYLPIFLAIMAILFVIAMALRFIAKHQWQKIEFLRIT